MQNSSSVLKEEVKELVVMMSDIFKLMIDTLQVALEYPTNDRHSHQGCEDRDQGWIFQGNADAHDDFICRKQRLRLMTLESKFGGLTMSGTGWGTNGGTITYSLWLSMV